MLGRVIVLFMLMLPNPLQDMYARANQSSCMWGSGFTAGGKRLLQQASAPCDQRSGQAWLHISPGVLFTFANQVCIGVVPCTLSLVPVYRNFFRLKLPLQACTGRVNVMDSIDLPAGYNVVPWDGHVILQRLPGGGGKWYVSHDCTHEKVDLPAIPDDAEWDLVEDEGGSTYLSCGGDLDDATLIADVLQYVPPRGREP